MAAWRGSGSDAALSDTLGSPIPVHDAPDPDASTPPRYRTGVALLAAAAVTLTAGLVAAANRGAPPSEPLVGIAVPGYASGDLEPGTYEVRPAEPDAPDPWFVSVPVEPPEISVWIDARAVAVAGAGPAWEAPQPLATFEVTEAGVYDVVADVPPGRSAMDLHEAVSVVRPRDAVRNQVLLVLLVTFLASGGLALMGIVSMVRTASRRRALRPPRPAYAAPSGSFAGYPGPYGGPAPGPYGGPAPGPYGQPVPPLSRPPGGSAAQGPDEDGFAPPS